MVDGAEINEKAVKNRGPGLRKAGDVARAKARNGAGLAGCSGGFGWRKGGGGTGHSNPTLITTLETLRRLEALTVAVSGKPCLYSRD